MVGEWLLGEHEELGSEFREVGAAMAAAEQ